jgi:hypothetical protein
VVDVSDATRVPTKIPKALRFQILRRDNHTCRYCGAAAPDVTLTVDHVVPVALGGQTIAENLVTSCEPCNTGKAATPPDAGHVADVKADALRWAHAMHVAAAIQMQQQERREAYIEAFDEAWATWNVQGSDIPIPRDENWRESVARFHDLGLEQELLLALVTRAMQKPRLHTWHVWKYFCGCCWGVLRDRAEMAAEMLGAEDAKGV